VLCGIPANSQNRTTVQPGLCPDHLQLLEAKPAAPSRLSSHSSTCASPSAEVTSASSRSSCASRPVGTGLAELDPTLPAEIAKRSPLAASYRAFERAIEDKHQTRRYRGLTRR
jgi:hypothetical protein